MMKKILIISILCFIYTLLSAQVIDRVIAVVGNSAILQSDIESQFQQLVAQGRTEESISKCAIFEELIYDKLLYSQAKIDSIRVGESQVESELDRRLRYFVNQIGSEEKMVAFFNKSIIQIKEEFRDKIRDQLMTQSMQQKITKNVKATPREIKEFYDKMPKDSLPFVNSEIEIGQIVKIPPIGENEKSMIIEKLTGIRNRIIKGEDFATLSVLYSDDPGSAAKGGELGLVKRGQLVPQFEAVAFTLEKGEISQIIETEYGYHIIQLIERRGEMVNVRHILIKPKVSIFDLQKANKELDSIRNLIVNFTITFSDAAQKFSSDDKSKYNGGLMINPATGNTKFDPSQVDPSVFFQIDKLKMGEISKPMIFTTADGKQGYRIVYLKSKTQPHIANLKDDYQRIQEVLLTKKQNLEVRDWIVKMKKSTFIKIDKDFQSCKFKYDWTSNVN